MSPIISNLLLYKLGWIACIVSAAQGKPWVGALAVATAATIHILSAKHPGKSIGLLAAAAVIGLLWESLLVSAGWVNYGVNSSTSGLAPYWIVTMWVLFATTLNVGFRWLKPHLTVAMIFGAVGGPLAFFAGSKAGAVTFTDTTVSLVLIGAGWAVLMPVLVLLSRRLDGHAPPIPSTAVVAGEANGKLVT